MNLETERSSSTSSESLRTPEKRSSKPITETGTRRTIGRSRRRRPTSTPSSNTAISAFLAESGGKENYPGHRSRRRETATTPIRNRDWDFIHEEENDQFASFGKPKTKSRQQCGPDCREMARLCVEALADFRKALSKTSVTSSLWSNFPELADTLIRISITKSSSTDALALYGQTSALLGLSRKLIKDISLAASGSGEEGRRGEEISLADNLFVSVHILRSIAFALLEEASIERKESLIKMFFHLISSTRMDKARKNIDKEDKERCKAIAVAGYEGLAKVLSSYSIQQQLAGGKQRIVSFSRTQIQRDSSNDLKEGIVFVIPSTARRKNTDSEVKSSKIGTMSTRQLSTIAFQTTMVVIKAILSLNVGSGLPYGNLGIDFGREFGSAGEDTITQWHQISMELLKRVHGPWLVLLAGVTIGEGDTTKEVLSYSKGIHRLLWEAASLRKSPSKTISAVRNRECDCLELRKQAILHLLTTTGIAKVDSLIRKFYFESGCSYAWKAASVFVQQISKSDIDKSLLSKFFKELDGAFDHLIACDPQVPLEFIEYEMHKSLHSGSVSSILATTFDFDHASIQEDEILNGNFRILLQIVNIAILSKGRIEAYLDNTRQQKPSIDKTDHEMSIDPMPALETIIYEFNWQVIHRMDEISNDCMNRILKLFCNLSLHKAMFLALKHIEAGESSSIDIFNQVESDLVVVATILTECLGPLISAFLNHNPQKVTQLADVMMECFLRPLSLYEQLYVAHSEHQESERVYFESSVNVAKYVTEILADDSMRPDDFVLPIQCIEKAAKSLYTIARKRCESSQKKESTFPLLFSIKLYEKLHSTNGTNKDYQLSSRLFLLSSKFLSMNKRKESIWVSCLLIRHESKKYALNLKDSLESNLLTYFSAKGSGLLPPSDDNVPAIPQVIRSACRQLSKDLLKVEVAYEESEAIDPFDDFAIASTMDLFLELFSCKPTEIHVPHPLHSILKLLCFTKAIDKETRVMQIIALAEILLEFGRCIHQYSLGSEFSEFRLDIILQNYGHLYQHLQNAIFDLDLGCPLVFSGLLGLTTSASLVPSCSIATTAVSPDCENGINAMLLEMAKEIVNENVENLSKPWNVENELQWSFLRESLHILIRNFGVNLERKTSETYCNGDLFEDFIDVAERFVGFQQTNRTSDTLMRANYWMIWVATYLQNELENRGDHIRAATLSLWTLALAEKIELTQTWFRAMVLNNSTNGGNVLCLKNFFDISSPEKDVPLDTALWIFQKEARLCEIRILALDCQAGDRDSFHPHMQQVEDILTELVDFQMEKTDVLFSLYMWVLSTAYLAQTDIASAFGCYTTALKTSQKSQKCCQTVLRRGSFGVANIDDWMVAAATSNVLVMAATRYIEVLSKRPRLYYRLGDHRKALAYTRSILEYLNIKQIPLTLLDIQENITEDFRDFLEAAPQVRIFLQMNSWASTPETTMKVFCDVQSRDLVRCRPDNTDEMTSSIVSSLQDLITIGDILYGESLSKRFQQKFSTFYDGATTLMTQYGKHVQIQSLRVPSKVKKFLGMPIADTLKLREVRRLLEAPIKSDEEAGLSIRRLCAQIKESKYASPEDKAWAYYYIGVVEIESARSSRALEELWNADVSGQNAFSDDGCDENILSARCNLNSALLLSSGTSDILQRNILRNLALVEGPDVKDSVGSSAGILILRSIGQSVRRKLMLSFDHEGESNENDSSKNLKDVFGVFDGQWKSKQDNDHEIMLFLSSLAAQTPANWRFVAPVICPSGEMLVSIIHKSHPNPDDFAIVTKCIFPEKMLSTYDVMMKPLDGILFKVQQHLQGVDPLLASKRDDKEAIKRKWWNERNRLDAEMCNLLERVESMYFSKVFDLTSAENIPVPPNSGDDLRELPHRNLSSRFEAAVNDCNESECDPEGERQERFDMLMKLTIPKLKDRLLSLGANKAQFRKLRKADLIELLIQIEDETQERLEVGNETDEGSSSDDCLLLILDENLHRFPFEGMPMLRGKTVCRIPCLSFALATLLEHKTDPKSLPFVDPAKTSYILNPENNLKATQDRILPAIQDISSSHNWNWDGVVGKIPSSPFFSDALCQKNGLVMYFGHGGAQVCFSRRQVDELIDRRGSTQFTVKNPSCRATVLLMGCSSGKLISINRKHSDSIEETPLYYEPEGVALSYLCAGAPCVVGNLWDVTDNDIDRFSIALMEDFLNANTSNSLAKSLSVSRSVCKLKHLVGCAPVCYGVPVSLHK